MLTQDIDFGKVQEKIYQSPRGAYSIFVKLSDKVGLKLFMDEKDRDDAYDRQFHAAASELGPEVYGKVDGVPVRYEINDFEDFYYSRHWDGTDEDDFEGFELLYEWGYLTELVEVCSYSDDDYSYKLFCDGFRQLKKDIADVIGFDFWDIKADNCGVKNGKLVCIDFGNTY